MKKIVYGVLIGLFIAILAISAMFLVFFLGYRAIDSKYSEIRKRFRVRHNFSLPAANRSVEKPFFLKQYFGHF
jgi:hypothetical protein